VLNAANEVAVHAFLEGRLPFLGIASVIEDTLAELPAERVRAFETLYDADRAARGAAREIVGRYAGTRSLRVAAFARLRRSIILHEAGHFAAAKAVGMRVEKFMLFFGKPLVASGAAKTYYASARSPLGGYVKITGMNPAEEIARGRRPPLRTGTRCEALGRHRAGPRGQPDPRRSSSCGASFMKQRAARRVRAPVRSIGPARPRTGAARGGPHRRRRRQARRSRRTVLRGRSP
jgi:hypothetical protein